MRNIVRELAPWLVMAFYGLVTNFFIGLPDLLCCDGVLYVLVKVVLLILLVIGLPLAILAGAYIMEERHDGGKFR